MIEQMIDDYLLRIFLAKESVLLDRGWLTAVTGLSRRGLWSSFCSHPSFPTVINTAAALS